MKAGAGKIATTHKFRQNNDIKISLKEAVYEGVGFIYDLWQGTVLSSCVNCNKPRYASKAGNLQRFRHL
jgi:hypothetical protein